MSYNIKIIIIIIVMDEEDVLMSDNVGWLSVVCILHINIFFFLYHQHQHAGA